MDGMGQCWRRPGLFFLNARMAQGLHQLGQVVGGNFRMRVQRQIAQIKGLMEKVDLSVTMLL
jgi:hypothetical protein